MGVSSTCFDPPRRDRLSRSSQRSAHRSSSFPTPGCLETGSGKSAEVSGVGLDHSNQNGSNPPAHFQFTRPTPNRSMHRTFPPRAASILRRFGYPGSIQLHAGGNAGDLQKLGRSSIRVKTEKLASTFPHAIPAPSRPSSSALKRFRSRHVSSVASAEFRSIPSGSPRLRFWALRRLLVPSGFEPCLLLESANSFQP